MGAEADNVKWNNFNSKSDSDDKPNYNHTSPKISEFDNDEVSFIKNKIYNLQYEIKRNKIYLNLIFYDERLSKENKFLYDYFQLNIVGGFYGVKEYCDFYDLLNQLNEHNLPFVLVTSGNSFQKIVPKNLSLKCIESIVIYCYDKNKYMNLYRNYYKVKLITNIFNEVKNFLEAKHFSSYEIDMENQIKTNPLISFYEYENCYFVFHKALSFFFKQDFSETKFLKGYVNELISYLNNDKDIDINNKTKIIKIMNKLKESNNFAEDVLKEYTSEDGFVYLFNKILRRIEDGILQLSFFIGPMYYSLVTYVKNNNSVGLNKDYTLYRKIVVTKLDLNMYFMEVGNIICFPSFTSTSLKSGFSTTYNALKTNNIHDKKVELEMIIFYKYSYNNISPGIIVGKNSYFTSEQEVLLFPFTFIKVISIDNAGFNRYKLKCEIINRDKILEFGLKNNKKIIYKNNKLTFDTFEPHYYNTEYNFHHLT